MQKTFASEEGQALLRTWDVPENYGAICFVILGYLDGEEPTTKPRKIGRVKIVEELKKKREACYFGDE